SNPYAAIQSKYETFPRVSKCIADYILEDPVHVTSISVQQMARELSIAESSIIRFCKNIGCSGFSEMKLMLAKYAPNSIRTIFEDLSETDSVESITQNVFNRNIDTIQRALDCLDLEKVAQAAELMSQAKKILILGVGASGTIAEDLYIRLMRVGLSAESFTDSHLMQIAASQCDKDTIVFGISHTGRSHEIISAMDLARSCGSKTISMTGYPNTPIQKVSDTCIELYSPEQLFVSPRVAQVSLLDSLYVALSIRHKKYVVQNIKRMNDALTDYRL
ncbi:MAG: MurR/RpiR family transcriptional regulator, partial [Eubacteriales bacterium]|nr:MurR/RpiR family transcriptional regulator [Eubacteriales bacterium]